MGTFFNTIYGLLVVTLHNSTLPNLYTTSQSKFPPPQLLLQLLFQNSSLKFLLMIILCKTGSTETHHLTDRFMSQVLKCILASTYGRAHDEWVVYLSYYSQTRITSLTYVPEANRLILLKYRSNTLQTDYHSFKR